MFDWLGELASSIWGVAKANPLATAGVVHGLTSTGDTGQALGNAAKYGALGYGADKVFSTSNWVDNTMDWAKNLGSSAGASSSVSPQAVSMPTEAASFTPAVQNNISSAVSAPMTVGASSSAGNFGNYIAGSAGDGDLGESAAREFMNKPASTFDGMYKNAARTASAVTPETGFSGAVKAGLNTARSGMDAAKQYGKDYGDVISMGTKLYGGLKSQQAGDKRIGDLNAMAQRSEASDAANRGFVDEQNAGARDVFAEQKARIGSAGLQAAKGVDAGVSRQLQSLDRNTALAPSARAALKQKAKVTGSLASAGAYNTADVNARAGLRAPSLASYASPSTSMRNSASLMQYENDSAVSPYADVADDLFGLSKEETAKQVRA